MKINREIASRVCLVLIAGVLAFGNAAAQDSKRATEEDRDKTKTKQAQAVSKAVYEKIQKAQEAVDAKDYSGALKTLNALYNPCLLYTSDAADDL